MVITQDAVQQSARFWSDLHANPNWHAFSQALALRGPRYARLLQLVHDQEYLHTLDMPPSQLRHYQANSLKITTFYAKHRACLSEVCPFVGVYEPRLAHNHFQALYNSFLHQIENGRRYQRSYSYQASDTDGVEVVSVDASAGLVSVKLRQAMPDLDVTMHLHCLSGNELSEVTWQFHHTLEDVTFESPYPLFREVEDRFIEPFNVIRVRETEMSIG